MKVSALAILLVASFAFGQQYFPSGAISSNDKMDGIKADWYSQELAALHEPSLWEASRKHLDDEVYRFLWLRSFHPAVGVRLIVNKDGSGSLISKQGKMHHVEDADTLVRVQTTMLSREQISSFLRIVGAVHFWKTPVPAENMGGADGSEWILEGEMHGTYKVVDVYSAPVGNAVRVLAGIMVFDLAHLRVPSNEIY